MKTHYAAGVSLPALHPAMLSAPRNDLAQPGLTEVKALVENAMKAFTEFQARNDDRLKEIEKKGGADPVLNEHVNRINASVGDLSKKIDDIVKERKREQDRLDAIELAQGRSGIGPVSGGTLDVRAAAAQMHLARTGQEVSPDSVDVEAYLAYRRAFNTYIRRGADNMTSEVRNAMTVGSDPSGGFFVTPERATTIVKRLYETSPVRQHATVMTISTDKLETPVDDDEASSGGWSGETTPPTDTDMAKVKMQTIEVHEQWAQPKATQRMLDDGAIDVEAWLTEKISDKLSRVENAAFVTGDGVKKPRGFMSYAVTGGTSTAKDSARAWGLVQYVKTGASGAFAGSGAGADALIDIVHAMKNVYRAGAIWAANRATFAEIRKLKDGDGNYLWSMGDVQKGQPSSLLGYETDEFEDMADIAANSFSLAFANFAVSYKILDRIGVTVLRDPYTGKPFVKFYARKRVGADIENFDAIKYLKFGTA